MNNSGPKSAWKWAGRIGVVGGKTFLKGPMKPNTTFGGCAYRKPTCLWFRVGNKEEF